MDNYNSKIANTLLWLPEALDAHTCTQTYVKTNTQINK